MLISNVLKLCEKKISKTLISFEWSPKKLSPSE